MNKQELTEQEYNDLLDFIISELMKKGIKALTMDSIASSRQISKRTLYEIFSNKDEMISEALKRQHNKITMAHREIYENSSNVMEGIVGCIKYNRDLMSMANVEYMRDIDNFIRQNHSNTPKQYQHFTETLLPIINKGKEEGFFLDDINYFVQCRILAIQMESLKRMEELFPPDITLPEVYDAISIGFLRSISSPKGIEALDKIITKIKN